MAFSQLIFSSIVTTPTGSEVNLKLAPNPSHLEAVNPVVEGFARAKADAKAEEMKADADDEQLECVIYHDWYQENTCSAHACK